MSTTDEEVEHLVTAHPGVIEERMLEAGFRLINGEWIDMETADDG